MMAKLALQLQSIVIVLTVFLIVIGHYVYVTSEPMRIYRGDYDTFDKPTCLETADRCTNCRAMNAYCNRYDTHLGCLECTCCGQYRTYLRYFGKCVRDNKLLFFSVGNNSFMIQQSESRYICINHDRSSGIKTANCNSSDPFQRWIWTRHNQLFHVETSKCIQQGKMFPGKMFRWKVYAWHLGLEECNVSETKQQWKCKADYLLKDFYVDGGQQNFMYITIGNGRIFAKSNAPTNWKRYESNSRICSSSFGCNEFANTSSAMLILDTKYQQQGEQQIADIPKNERCFVIWDRLQFWDYHNWKHLVLGHEFRENIFSISNTATSGKLLNWNLTRTPSNWTNLIIKLNFKCSSASGPMDSSTAETSTRCVVIKLKYPSADSFGCNEFANTSSAILILDTKYQQQGEQQIADIPKNETCFVTWERLQFWDYHNWKHLVLGHEFREIIFSISTTTTSGKLLKWNLTRVPSNWTNLIIKLNFNCSSVSEPMDSPTAETSTRCVVIKLKYPSADCPTTASTTVSSSEATPTKSPTSATTAESSTGTVNTSHPPRAKSSTSSKEQQEGESSSVVGIVVGLLAAILVLCGIILGYFCYKRRKSRLDKTSSNVEINGKGKSSGDTLNPIYSSEDNKNPSLSNDGGIYQEPDGNTSAASQECDLYEPGGDHEYDYAKVEQKNKPAPPSEELEYDYAKTDDIKSAVQRAPVRGNAYQDTVIENKNTATNANEDRETGNDTGPLYQTLEDETAPVYQTLASE